VFAFSSTLLGINIAFAQPADLLLTWSPPALVSPETIVLGTGKTSTTLDTTKDYIIKLPTSLKTGSTTIIGGRNIIMIGGHITIPPTDPTADPDLDRRAVYLKNNVGVVHIEGLLIDGTGGGEMDGIAINSPLSTVQLQNLRIVGVKGTDSTMHADVVQPWGGVKELRIDKLTGESYYQGLFIPVDQNSITKTTVLNTNLRAYGQAYGGGGGGYMLTLTKYGCSTYAVKLENVYVEPRPGRQLNKSVWPDINTASTQGCKVNIAGNTANWPTLTQIEGSVVGNAPPNGDFVPAVAVGLRYSSPGYKNSSTSSSPSTDVVPTRPSETLPSALQPSVNSPTPSTTEDVKHGLNEQAPSTTEDVKHGLNEQAPYKQTVTNTDNPDNSVNTVRAKSSNINNHALIFLKSYIIGAGLISCGIASFLLRHRISHNMLLRVHNHKFTRLHR